MNIYQKCIAYHMRITHPKIVLLVRYHILNHIPIKPEPSWNFTLLMVYIHTNVIHIYISLSQYMCYARNIYLFEDIYIYIYILYICKYIYIYIYIFPTFCNDNNSFPMNSWFPAPGGPGASSTGQRFTVKPSWDATWHNRRQKLRLVKSCDESKGTGRMG